jgi:hypothetical protein
MKRRIIYAMLTALVLIVADAGLRYLQFITFNDYGDNADFDLAKTFFLFHISFSVGIHSSCNYFCYSKNSFKIKISYSELVSSRNGMFYFLFFLSFDGSMGMENSSFSFN